MMKINSLEIENVKRIKAVRITPTESGLTVIGGDNGQGKTSVLDAIAWALGGDKYRPSSPQREGSVIPPYLRIVMQNGLVVERKGKNSELKVTDPNGRKGGQQLLNEFVEGLALNLPKFMNAGSREKADTLLRIIGVGDKLYELENRENELYNRRRAIGQIADQKAKFAKEMVYYPDAPKTPVSVSELIKQQQDILARNGENERIRHRYAELKREKEHIEYQMAELQKRLDDVTRNFETAGKAASELVDESTAELEKNIADIEKINIKVRANLDKEFAEEDAKQFSVQYEEMTNEIESVRNAKKELLSNASLPLPGLSVEGGELTYNGCKWDCMSSSDQLKVSTAIVRRLNPECGFVLLDKLEQMDTNTLRDFGEWIEKEGLQAIATRVSKGEECSVIISDGCIQPKQWKAGEF